MAGRPKYQWDVLAALYFTGNFTIEQLAETYQVPGGSIRAYASRHKWAEKIKEAKRIAVEEPENRMSLPTAAQQLAAIPSKNVVIAAKVLENVGSQQQHYLSHMRQKVSKDVETFANFDTPTTAKELHSQYLAGKALHDVASPVLGLDQKTPHTVVNVGILDGEVTIAGVSG